MPVVVELLAESGSEAFFILSFFLSRLLCVGDNATRDRGMIEIDGLHICMLYALYCTLI